MGPSVGDVVYGVLVESDRLSGGGDDGSFGCGPSSVLIRVSVVEYEVLAVTGHGFWIQERLLFGATGKRWLTFRTRKVHKTKELALEGALKRRTRYLEHCMTRLRVAEASVDMLTEMVDCGDCGTKHRAVYVPKPIGL